MQLSLQKQSKTSLQKLIQIQYTGLTTFSTTLRKTTSDNARSKTGRVHTGDKQDMDQDNSP